jgi:carbonic anhydrase
MERSTILEHMIQNGEIGIVGGMHDLATGEVSYYLDTTFISQK